MKLTAITIKGIKPKDKAYKLMDGAGLYMMVDKAGRKYWIYNYRYMVKHKTLSIGVYPDISLKEAREQHQQARKKVADKSTQLIKRNYRKRLS